MTGTRPTLGRALLDDAALVARSAARFPEPALLGLPEKIVQFGTGAFLRGFVEHFVDAANRRGRFGGRVVMVGSTGSGRDAALAEQDGLYTLAVQGLENGRAVQEYRVISSVSRALSAAREWDAVLAVARDPDIELVFSNTTEVGIALDADDRPDLSPPRSFPGKLARFLLERGRAVGWSDARGVVVLPCELIERNGRTLRDIVLALAERWQVEPEFRAWVERAVPFCDTLVDRIVPGAPKGDDRERAQAALGYEDAMLTTCEVYRLFAIEADARAAERLRFLAEADAGVVLTDDVSPYRERKVRLLNGAHTLTVPVAMALGCRTVREAVTHDLVGPFVRAAMLDEIAPVVRAPGAAQFAHEVLDRFANPYVRHALVDISLQATMKMRVRVVPSIVAHAARTGQPPHALAFGFAAFLDSMREEARRARAAEGLPLLADDGAEALAAHWAAHSGAEEGTVGALVRDVCADAALWGTDLAAVPGFAAAVADHLWRIRADGMRAALDHLLAARAA